MGVPYLDYRHIRPKVEEFLRAHNPSGEVPIPIEEIVEFKLGMDVLPLRGLRDILDAEGYLSADRTTIVVDEHQYDHQPDTLRFTIAHELGHLVLHESYYSGFGSVDEYREFRASLSPLDIEHLDTQANKFAGLLLVPTEKLQQIGEEIVSGMIVQLEARGATGVSLRGDPFRNLAAQRIAPRFGVHWRCARIRMDVEKLWPQR